MLGERGLPDDVVDKIATMSVVPAKFDQAFPAMARHMTSCNGELWFFSRGSEGGDFVRFDSCGTSPFCGCWIVPPRA